MDSEEKKWSLGLGLMGLALGILAARWIFFPVVTGWDPGLALGRRILMGACFWGGVLLIKQGTAPTNLGIKVAAFLGAVGLGAGAMWSAGRGLDAQLNAERQPLAEVELRVRDVPGLRILFPDWEVRTDAPAPAAGTLSVKRGTRPSEMATLSWSVGGLATTEELREMVLPLFDALSAEPVEHASFEAEGSLEQTSVHQWRLDKPAITLSVSAFRCPGDNRAFAFMTGLAEDLATAAKFHQRLVAGVECLEGFEAKAPQFPRSGSARAHSEADDSNEGIRGYSFEGLGELAISTQLAPPASEAMLTKDPKVRKLLLEMMGYRVVDADPKAAMRRVGTPSRPAWKLRVQIEPEENPPIGEFELLLSALTCGGGVHLLIFLPEDEQVDEGAYEVVADVSCPAP